MCYERHDHSHDFDYVPVTEAAPAPVAEPVAPVATEVVEEIVELVSQDELVLTK